MSEALPWFFAALACGALGAALMALFASFRAAFVGAVPVELSSEVDHDARLRLVDEKDALLKNLADLRFDHDAGKISEADFARLDNTLRERAKTVMRLLDADVEPFRAEAEALIAARLGGTPRDPFREAAPERGAPRPPEEVATEEEKTEARETALAAQEAALVVGVGRAGEAELAAGAAAKPSAATATKACPNCTTDNDADAVFCKKCGHRFEGAPSEDDASTVANDEARGAEEER